MKKVFGVAWRVNTLLVTSKTVKGEHIEYTQMGVFYVSEGKGRVEETANV